MRRLSVVQTYLYTDNINLLVDVAPRSRLSVRPHESLLAGGLNLRVRG
jgi:hypothetical protein